MTNKQFSPSEVFSMVQDAGLAPVGNKVFLVLREKETTYGSGIIARTEQSQFQELIGTVVAHGDEVSPQKRDFISIGDRVQFRTGTGETLRVHVGDDSFDVTAVSVLDLLLRRKGEL